MIEKPCPDGITTGAGLLLTGRGQGNEKSWRKCKKVLTDASSACIIIQVTNGNGKQQNSFFQYKEP